MTTLNPDDRVLRLAVPSKGRLKDHALDYFSRAGLALEVEGGNRGYTATMSGLDGVDVVLLPAQEIAGSLAAGSLDIGVTGLDLLDEQDSLARGAVYVVLGMGFGRADVVVAVPSAWIDVATMEDLDDVAALYRHSHGQRMRVATKYLTLTRRFFAAHGVGDYRIVESPGATEAAPNMGAAELIVDISSTGVTLRDNRLKILDDGIILRSEAVLAASLAAAWSADRLALLETLLTRLGSVDSQGTPAGGPSLLAGLMEALARAGR